MKMINKLTNRLSEWNKYYEDPLSFSLKFICKPKTVLHCGSHLGEENEIYMKFGIDTVWWVEAQARVCKVLRAKFGSEFVFEGALWSKSGETLDFHITDNSLSSSLYEIGSNKWNVKNVSIEKVVTITLDNILREIFLQKEFAPELAVLDLQGAELEALRGGVNRVGELKYLLVEVSKKPVYKGVPDLELLELQLEAMGFKPVREFINSETGHGEVMYSRLKLGLTMRLRIVLNDILQPVVKSLNKFLRRVDQKANLLFNKFK